MLLGLHINPRSTSEFKDISVEDALRLLESSENGLAETEAEGRIKTFGPNEVAEKKRIFLFEFISRFWGPMPWLLDLTAILSFLWATCSRRLSSLLCS